MLILFPSSREGILYEKNIDWALFIELKIIEAIHLNFIIFISPFKTFLAILSFPFIVNNTLHPLHVCEQAFRIQFPCNLCKPAPKNPITYFPSKLYPNTSFQYFANAQSIHLPCPSTHPKNYSTCFSDLQSPPPPLLESRNRGFAIPFSRISTPCTFPFARVSLTIRDNVAIKRGD